MEERCQLITAKVCLFTLVILTSLQSFERITFTEAALEDRDISTTDCNTWRCLLFTAFCVNIVLLPWLSAKIGVQTVAKIGASLSMFVAFCLWLVNIFVHNDEQFITLVQVLAVFAGTSDCMLAASILTVFINTSPSSSRGWNFGLMFVSIVIGFVFGIDHKGALGSLEALENTDEPTFTIMCFLSITVSLILLVLISMVVFERVLVADWSLRNSYGGNEKMLYHWWKSFSFSGVRWGCLVVTVFALILAYIKTKFLTELEVKYSYDMDSVMNIALLGILGFLLACPIIGWFGDKFQSLNVMMSGNYALAISLFVLAFVVDGVEADDMTVAFVTICFGVCSVPSIVMSLITIHENLEAEYICVSGSVTSSLYLGCWMVGILGGLLLEYEMSNLSFQEMAVACSAVEIIMGLLATLFTTLGVLRQPIVEPLEKQLFAERKEKTPYVVENNWESI